MKALTIWQPWASLIMMGAKPFEFRGWKPPSSLIGQRIAIHAGARPVKVFEVRALLASMRGDSRDTNPCLHAEIAIPILERVDAAFEKSPDTLFGTREQLTLPLSCVLGTAILGRPITGDRAAQQFGYDAGNDSDREGTFNWAWPLTDIEHFEPPVNVRGAQGLWDFTRSAA